MKSKIITLLSNPKKVIAVTAVVAVIAGIGLYHFVGRAPAVAQDTATNATQSSVADGSVSLAFLVPGKVATVAVKAGDTVTAGEALARLDSASAQGALNAAKGALELAENQYGSLDLQYQNAKKQQDQSGARGVHENADDRRYQPQQTRQP